MIKYKLSDMTNGWFVGDFEPTSLKTEKAEVSIKKYKAKDKEDKHYHKIATEITTVVSGIIKMNDLVLEAGDIVSVEPNEIVAFEALTSAVIVAVKIPSIINDKYIVE